MQSIREECMGGLSDPRVLFAAERTLLAWVRTGLTIMAFGFVVARFGLSLHDVPTVEEQVLSLSPGYSVWIGAGLILLGVITNILSAVQHVRTLSRFRSGEQYHPSTCSLSLVTTGALAALGLVMIGYLMVSSM